jgi:hypothetical protein
VSGDHLSQVRAKGFSVGGAVEPGGLQAEFARLCGVFSRYGVRYTGSQDLRLCCLYRIPGLG